MFWFKSKEQLEVEVFTPDHALFEGSALAVTAKNSKGTFDVIPYHSGFITTIKDTLIVYQSQDNKHTFTNIEGVLRCFNNKVDIYLKKVESK